MKMRILKDILSLPTAPFHEWAVADYVSNFCARLKLRVRRDATGSLVVHYRRGRPRQRVVLTSHMDHPGFEVLKAGGDTYEVGILGGMKPEFFAGARVVIKTAGSLVRGRVSKRPLKKRWYGKPVFKVEVEAKVKDKIRTGDFGWYDLPQFKMKGDIVFTKSADNLVSTAVLLDLLATLVRKRVKADVRCVFTRAEEVGFVGCMSLAKQRLISKDAPIIVLECSSAPAARVDIDGGPVLRVGDKLSSYNPHVDCWLRKTAEALSKKDRGFLYQRALLGGGTCEASVWNFHRYPAGGLAFPLGNYHNNGPKGPAPEFVSASDYKNMLKLLVAIAGAPAYRPILKVEFGRIEKNYRLWRGRLYG